MHIFLLILAGIVGGIVGGMGMGGGTLLIPILTLFFNIPQHSAQAINLVAFIPMAIIVIIIHCKNKLVDFKEAVWVVVPALVTTIICSLFVNKISGDILKKAFGGFLVLLGGVMLLNMAIKQTKKYIAKKKEHVYLDD